MTDDRRSIELEVEVPGTPEEVWAAIATGPGIGSWFVPTTVEEREGGEVVQQFGPGESMEVRSRVQVWDPPNRVVFGGHDDAAAPAAAGIAFEWRVEARDGGTCVVRLVNSGFGSGDDWDAQYDGMESGWRMFLHNLVLHRRSFPGREAVAVLAMAMAPIGRDDAWATLREGLGIPEGADVGDRLVAGPDAPTALDGTVERSVDRMLTLQVDEPAEGTALVAVEGIDGQAAISVWLWLYGDDARERSGSLLTSWQTWLEARYPSGR